MLVLAGKIHDLTNLGLGNFVCKYATLADTVVMNMQHYTRRIVHVLLKKTLQDMNDKLHGSIVIIEKQDAIEAWLLCFRLRTRDHHGAVVRSVPAVGLALHDWIRMPHENYHPMPNAGNQMSGPNYLPACPYM